MVMKNWLALLSLCFVAACSSRANLPKEAPSAPEAAPEADAPVAETNAPVRDAGGDAAGKSATSFAIKISTGPTPPSPPAELAAWLRKQVPTGGEVIEGDPPRILHTVQKGETAAKIAEAYLGLSEVYYQRDFASALAKKNPKGFAPGAKVEIPQVVTRVIRDPKEERLGWPPDKTLRGVFVTASYAGIRWVDTLDKLAARGLNAVVLDGKDYEGWVPYPSKAKIAVETGATRPRFIPDLARAIRFAHWRGIHVIIRIPCFHDPWADKHAKDSRLSVRYTPTGKPIHIKWIDPANKEAQDYNIELAQEAVDAGADEVQLDYVRFPVHLSTRTAMLPQPKDRSGIIRDFVRRVRAVTQPAGVGLSLDLFGVAATGSRSDIEALGQDIATVAPEADAISLMSYPSHYSKGYMGFKEPADHPEIIAIGNKAALKQLAPTGAKTILRTWLQAFPMRVTNYGAKYVVAQARHAEESGGVGWLMWSPGCEYSAVWKGWPVLKKGDGQEVAATK
jgi:hypothetical protein